MYRPRPIFLHHINRSSGTTFPSQAELFLNRSLRDKPHTFPPNHPQVHPRLPRPKGSSGQRTKDTGQHLPGNRQKGDKIHPQPPSLTILFKYSSPKTLFRHHRKQASGGGKTHSRCGFEVLIHTFWTKLCALCTALLPLFFQNLTGHYCVWLSHRREEAPRAENSVILSTESKILLTTSTSATNIQKSQCPANCREPSFDHVLPLFRLRQGCRQKSE